MEKKERMEKELVEKELSQLMEVTLRLEDELNSAEFE
jgi:hypothetical protein